MSTDPIDDLRVALATKIIQVANTAGIGIRMPNMPFDEPTDGTPWGEYHLMMGKTARAELGGGAAGLQRTVGWLQFDFLVQENTGDGAINRAASAFKAAFQEITVPVGPGYFRTQAMGVQQMGKDLSPRGYYRLCVDGRVDYFFYDTRAQVVTS